jgi:hypothetical protein
MAELLVGSVDQRWGGVAARHRSDTKKAAFPTRLAKRFVDQHAVIAAAPKRAREYVG